MRAATRPGPVEGEVFPRQEGTVNLPKGWSLSTLEEICEPRKTLVQPGSLKTYRYLGLEHLEPGNPVVRQWGQDTELASTKSAFESDDVLYGKLRPYLDKAALAPWPGIASTDILVLRAIQDRSIPEFLVSLLHTEEFIRHAVSHTAGTNHPRTSWDAIRRFTFGLPSVPEQRRITEILGEANDGIHRTDEIIAELEKLKKALMQRLFLHGIDSERSKPTSIGQIPAAWGTTELGNVLTLCQYGLSIPLQPTGTYPILRMNNLVEGRAVDTNLKFADLPEGLFKQFKLERGDILFNRTNSIDLVGKVGIFGLEGDFTFASYLIRLRTDSQKADSAFVNYYLNWPVTQRRLKELATRAASQANINATNLKKFLIPLPPMAEQRRIVAMLGELDNKLQTERRRRDASLELKQGLMQQLLIGKMRVKM